MAIVHGEVDRMTQLDNSGYVDLRDNFVTLFNLERTGSVTEKITL